MSYHEVDKDLELDKGGTNEVSAAQLKALINAGGLHARVGTFSPAATGNYSVTGLGFKPKVIEFFVCKNDGLQTWFVECHGFVDDTGHQNCSCWVGNYSNTFKGDMKTDRCIYDFNASAVLQVNATWVSMNNDGFTLNFTNVNTAFTIRYMAIG